MNVLAIDTASSCSVAVLRGEEIAARRAQAIARGHAEALMPMIEGALADAGLRYGELELIAAAIGPGSFTGLRTGLAAARGLALALGKPTRGIGNLEAWAAAARAAVAADHAILVALDTKRASVYAQAFSAALAPLSAPAILSAAEAAALAPAGALAVTGDAGARLAASLARRRPAPVFLTDMAPADAAVVARLAARRHSLAAAAVPLRPLYLEPPQAVPEAAGGRMRS